MIPKLRSRRGIVQWVNRLRRQEKRIVFTNGCFDILHAGHVSYLERAKRFGDVLIVGLNSDGSVRKIKGAGRPISSEKDRARVLAGLSSVDAVVIFKEDTPRQLIRAVKPHVLVKGADWAAHQIAGAKDLRVWGGVLRRIPLLAGRSTSRLIRKAALRHRG